MFNFREYTKKQFFAHGARGKDPVHFMKGQAAIIGTFLMLLIMIIVTYGFSSLALAEERTTRALREGAQSFATAESGAEDAVYRFVTGRSFISPRVIFIGDTHATTTVISNGADKEIFSEGSALSHIQRVRTFLTTSSQVQFFYGVQAGEGGLRMENSASIKGNVYSNGPVTGQNNNITRGTVVSAGPAGLIDGIHATSSGYAHTILDSEIDGDAYYQVISNTTVLGTQFPGSPDQATSTLPISDSLIEEWKTGALAGGVISSPCPYIIETSQTIGPKKINCDLEIKGTPTVTLEGPLWVSGNIKFTNSPIIRSGSGLGSQSVAIIADNPSNRTTSSQISIQNSAEFIGSDSYILLVSQNESAEAGGSETAIDVKNSVMGDLLVYAGHGIITIQNNIDVKEVTAWKILIKNSAEVIYETGLANLLFNSGPGGGFTLSRWREVE